MSCSREYHNTFNRANRYFEVRMLTGDPRQSREDNEEQAILRDLIQRVADGFWVDGSVVKGCGLTSLGGGAYQVQPGWVYVKGIVHEAAMSESLTPSTSGRKFIGFRVNESVVSHQEDAALRDPAIGVPNEGLPGADRLKLEVEWLTGTYTDCGDPVSDADPDVALDGVYPVFMFRDGVLVADRSSSIFAFPGIAPVLETRTAVESGDYVYDGLTVIEDQTTAGANSATVTIAPGGAVIQGRTYVLPNPRALVADFTALSLHGGASKTTASAVGSLVNVPYLSAGTALQMPHDAEVKRVTLSVKVTQTIQRGNLVDAGIFNMDQLLMGLPEGTVVTRVLSVRDATQDYQPLNGLTGDYSLIAKRKVIGTGDSRRTVLVSYLDWRDGDQQPANDASYDVELVYEKVLEPAEYSITLVGADTKIVAVTTSWAPINPVGPNHITAPIAWELGYWNVTFEDQYLAFYIYLKADCDGELIWALESTNALGQIVPEYLDTSTGTPNWVQGEPPRAIRLARVEIQNGVVARVTTYDRMRVTQQELREMVSRRNDFERLLMDLMSHVGRASSRVSKLGATDTGYDPYDPRPKKKTDEFYDGRSTVSDYTYDAVGRLRQESIEGRDPFGNPIYTAVTKFDYIDNAPATLDDYTEELAYTEVVFVLTPRLS